MMIFGGCGAYRNLSSTKMIEAMEMQKDMIRMEVEKNIEENNRKESDETIAVDSLDLDEAESDVSIDVESSEEENNRVTIKFGTNRIGTNLTGYVHFNSRVDGDLFFISADHRYIIYIGDVQHIYHRVVVNKVIQLSRTNGKTTDDLSGVDLFEFIGDHTCFNQGDHAV